MSNQPRSESKLRFSNVSKDEADLRTAHGAIADEDYSTSENVCKVHGKNHRSDILPPQHPGPTNRRRDPDKAYLEPQQEPRAHDTLHRHKVHACQSSLADAEPQAPRESDLHAPLHACDAPQDHDHDIFNAERASPRDLLHSQAPWLTRLADISEPFRKLRRTCYVPPTALQDVYRSIIVSNLPGDISILRLLAHIRGGLIILVVLAPLPIATARSTKSAYIQFARESDAHAYCQYREANPLVLGQHEVKFQHMETPTWPLSQHMVNGIKMHNHTRCLLIKKLPSGIKCEQILAETLNSESCILFRWKGPAACLEFSSLGAAEQAYSQLMSNRLFANWEISFDMDPCSQPLETLRSSPTKPLSLSPPQAPTKPRAARSPHIARRTNLSWNKKSSPGAFRAYVDLDRATTEALPSAIDYGDDNPAHQQQQLPVAEIGHESDEDLISMSEDAVKQEPPLETSAVEANSSQMRTSDAQNSTFNGETPAAEPRDSKKPLLDILQVLPESPPTIFEDKSPSEAKKQAANPSSSTAAPILAPATAKAALRVANAMTPPGPPKLPSPPAPPPASVLSRPAAGSVAAARYARKGAADNHPSLRSRHVVSYADLDDPEETSPHAASTQLHRDHTGSSGGVNGLSTLLACKLHLDDSGSCGGDVRGAQRDDDGGETGEGGMAATKGRSVDTRDDDAGTEHHIDEPRAVVDVEAEAEDAKDRDAPMDRYEALKACKRAQGPTVELDY